MRTEDGKGSGYATRGYNDITKLDTKKATQIAAEKGIKSATAKAIEPGKYTVILEPAAAAVLLENIFFRSWMPVRQMKAEASLVNPVAKHDWVKNWSTNA